MSESQRFTRHDGTLIATLSWRNWPPPPVRVVMATDYWLDFDPSATPRERELFAEYLSDCFADAAAAVADCVAQGIRGTMP